MKNYTKLLALGTAAVSALGVDALVSNFTLKTTKYTYKTGLPKEKITLAVVSDMHFAKFGKDNKFLIRKIADMKPDLILVPGDFYDYHHGKTNESLATATLAAFARIAPTYFSPGNHDKRFDARTLSESKGRNSADHTVRSMAESVGVTVLDGEYVDITVKGREIRLGGMFDYAVFREDYSFRWKDNPMNKFLQNFENTNRLKILLAHRPNTFIFTADEPGARRYNEPFSADEPGAAREDDHRDSFYEPRDTDIVFCGHVHGGMWRIPFFHGVYGPEQGFFPKYDRGEYDFGKMKMYVSTGLEGFYEIPRLNMPAEVIKFEIE